MAKNGHGAPDECRVYDAEGNYLYGFVDRQLWTAFRIYGQDGSLIYVGLTRSKHLKKRLGQLDLSGTVAKGEYPTRQQAGEAEKRYVRQMGFPKYGLSAPGLRNFGPHEGTQKYIQNPQAPGKRDGKVLVQRHPSQESLRKVTVFGGTYSASGSASSKPGTTPTTSSTRTSQSHPRRTTNRTKRHRPQASILREHRGAQRRIIDRLLIPPGTQYGATHSKPEK